MRKRRIKLTQRQACYHLCSRTVDRDFKFRPEDRTRICDILLKVAGFSCVKILNYAVLSNHFHILALVPVRPKKFSEKFIRDKIEKLYEGKALADLYERWEQARENGMEELVQRELRAFSLRMFDVSEFMKTFKQRVTADFNKRHRRGGTLWEGRFKSVLVEDDPYGLALRSISAYIDLNPVRAGLVDNPARYRFSAYGKACAGNKEARVNLMKVLPSNGKNNWSAFQKTYRNLLYKAEEGKRGKTAANRLERAMAASLTLPEILRHSVRYFTDGYILGSKEFVNEMFSAYRDRFGPKRKDGARTIPCCSDWRGKVYSARCLRKNVISPLAS